MKRCPTVPVAPRTATLRLRIAVKSDVSEDGRGEPAPLRVNPMDEAEARFCERRKHLVVVHHVPALDPNLPVTVRPAVVVDRLVDAISIPGDLRHTDRDRADVPFGRCRIVPDLRVIPLDQGDAVRREVASNGAE